MYQSSRILSLALALAATILYSPGVTAQADSEKSAGPPEIIKLIKGANSRERYEALARYYDEQAEKAHKEALNYKAQYECYVEQEKANKEAGIELGASKLSSFCYRERNQYSEIAKENEALAKMYRDMAQQVAKPHPGNPSTAK
jgi:hypothetical protein